MESTLTNRALQLLRVVMVVMLFGACVLIGRPAQAEPIPGGQPVRGNSPFTELRVLPITGELGVSNVDAFDAPLDTFNPLEGYPAAADIPATWDAHLLGYAGLIPTADNEGNQVLTYCIDLFTSTQSGVTYERDDWTEANVRNLGYVAHVLQNYYPAEPEQPAGVANNVRAAAVQAAIWFFSDNLVVNPTLEPQLYALTSAIVADAIENGPAAEPPQPSLDISPDSALAPSTGELVGPFTVTADGPSVLRLEGVDVFADAAGTQQLAAGDTVAPGTQFWVRSTAAGEDQGFSLQRLQTIRESTVYLYDGGDPQRETAQKLILARDTQLEAVAGVRVTQFAAGGLQVTKTIGGEAAGLQGALEIRVVCTPPDEGDPIERTITIPARAPAGAQPPTTVTGVPAGSTCVITEPENGDNQRVNVTATAIDPETVTIVEGETAAVAVTNDYELARGGLQVTKRIGGPAAGEQGEIVLLLDCDDAGDAFDQELTVPAGTIAGEYPVATVTGIPVGTECTVTETETGVTDTIVLDTPTIISPADVTIDEDETSEVTVTNNYREEENGGGDDDNGGDEGGGGGGGGGGDYLGGGGGGFLPDAGAPNETVPLLPLGIALVAAGSLVLIAERRLGSRRL